MGELIRTIGTINLCGKELDVEINHSSNGSIEYEIHVQNDEFRLSLPEKQFSKILTCIMLSRKQLHQIKKMD